MNKGIIKGFLKFLKQKISSVKSADYLGSPTYYKKRSTFNGWKRERATMRVEVTGTSFNNNCDLMPQSQAWDRFLNYKKRKSRKVVDRIWGLWREALVDDTNPQWPAEGSIVHGFFRNDNNYFPVVLRRD